MLELHNISTVITAILKKGWWAGRALDYEVKPLLNLMNYYDELSGFYETDGVIYSMHCHGRHAIPTMLAS